MVSKELESLTFKRIKLRSNILGAIFIFVLLMLNMRLYVLQVMQYSFFKQKATGQHVTKYSILPKRGKILDCRLRELAISIPNFSAFAVPEEIQNSKMVIEKLSKVLNLKRDLIDEKLNGKNKKFVWIKRILSEDETKVLRDLDLDGVYLKEESKRSYPGGNLMSHILGFSDIDGKGLEGIEKQWDAWLSGKAGMRLSERDAQGREIRALRTQDTQSKDGLNVVLTLDAAIQTVVEEELEKVVYQYKAESASAIVMNPKTGEVLAMANFPTFDPNEAGKAQASARRNLCVTDSYEPGSTFKPLVLAAVVNENLVKISDVFHCENGSYRIGRHVLHDVHPYELLTVQQIIERSSNIGMAKVAQKMTPIMLHGYLDSLGFGKKTGIALPGEAIGILKHPKYWSKLTPFMIPMGQEIAVTSIQLITAYCTLANGGELVRPVIVHKIVDQDFNLVQKFMPEHAGQVYDSKIARQIVDVLKGVVSEKGTAQNAQIDGYTVAGKTGTAQKIDPKGGYSHSDYMSSFIGFLPANNPEVAILVVVNAPKPVHYGGVVAAPVFKEVGLALMRYLEVPPNVLLSKKNKK